MLNISLDSSSLNICLSLLPHLLIVIQRTHVLSKIYIKGSIYIKGFQLSIHTTFNAID